MKRWLIREPPAGSPPRGLARELSISPLLLDILWRRGLDSPEELDAYLSARLPDLVPPSRWPQFPQAAEVISKALLDGKKLAVWGDYDVDGVTSSTLVLDVLEAHGLEALWHVPDRRSEGYGLNIPAIEELAAQGGAALIGAVAVTDRKPLDAFGFLKNINDLRYERRIRLRVEQAFLALIMHVCRRGEGFHHLVGRPYLHPGHDVHHVDGGRADGGAPPASGTALHAEALFDILQLVVDPVAHSRSLGARVMELRVPGERYRLARVPDPDAGAGMGRVPLLFGGEAGTGGANARAPGTGDAA